MKQKKKALYKSKPTKKQIISPKLGIGISILFVSLFIIIIYSSQPQVFTGNAANNASAITPTFGTIGDCQTMGTCPTNKVSPTGSITSTPVSSLTTISTNTSIQPCAASQNATLSIMSEHRQKNGNNRSNGFLQFLLQFLQQLLQLFQRLLGSTTAPMPTPVNNEPRQAQGVQPTTVPNMAQPPCPSTSEPVTSGSPITPPSSFPNAATTGYTHAPGYPGKLTTYSPVPNGTNCSGPITSGMTYKYCDFNSGGGGVNITGSKITFIGDRFQSNNTQDQNVQTTGTNITFSYDSFTPRTSFYTSPPGEVWPSAGSGQNTTTQTQDVNAINGGDGYEYGINILSGGPVTVDHSDIWGFGNAIVFYATTAQMNITNNWIHDAAYAGTEGYHTDGPGYLNSGQGPSNILIQGNTIASLGNTNGIAFQAATSGYSNMQIIGNYISGFGYTVDDGFPGSNHFTNSTFKDNVFGTDIDPVWNPLYGWADGTGDVWKCNTISVRAGTSWTDGDGWKPTIAMNNQYWVPTGSITSSTDYLGNTTCP